MLGWWGQHISGFYLNSDKPFLTMSDRYCHPERGFKPRSLSECLLEFDTCSKPLGPTAGHLGCYSEDIFPCITIFQGPLTTIIFWNQHFIIQDDNFFQESSFCPRFTSSARANSFKTKIVVIQTCLDQGWAKLKLRSEPFKLKIIGAGQV